MPDTIVISDSFNVASNTNISVHTTDQSDGYIEIAGLFNNSHQFIVESSTDEVKFKDSGSTEEQAWFVDKLLNSNSFIEVRMDSNRNADNTYFGAILRGDAEGGGRGIQFDFKDDSGDNARIVVNKIVGGNITQLTTESLLWAANIEYTVKFEAIDTPIVNQILVLVRINDNPVFAFAFSDSALYKKIGKCALYARRSVDWGSNSEITFDNLKAGNLNTDLPEFVDGFRGAPVEENLNNRNLLFPSSSQWSDAESQSMQVVPRTQQWLVDEKAEARDPGGPNYFLHRANSNLSNEAQYAEVICECTDRTANNTKMGVAVRSESSKAIVATLDGGDNVTNQRRVELGMQENVLDFYTLQASFNLEWNTNTKYKVRLEVSNLNANDIECKVYIDDILRITHIIANAALYSTVGAAGVYAKGASNWVSNDKVTFHSFEAGIFGEKTHEFTGSGNTSFDGSISIEVQKMFDGSSDATFDGNVELRGGIVSFNGTSDITFEGSTDLNGLIKEFGGSVDISFDSSITTLISQKLFESDAASGLFSGSINMEVSDFSFKWSLDNLEARTDYGFPTVYVDLDKDAIPVGAFPEGDFYERRLLQMPRLQEVELDTRFGISGFQRVTFTVDNSDRLISGLDLQDSFVRMLFVDDDGKVYKDFKGKVVDWTLSHQVTINVEDIEALAFTQDLPKRTLNDVIESEKASLSGNPLTEFANSVVADDLGKPVPIIFGRAIKVPLLYVKADETIINQQTQESKREYDYIIGEGTGLNNKFFKEVFTVYRDDQALDNFAGLQQGIAQGGNFNSIILDADHERPDGWFKYFWIFITSGQASGDIKFVQSYSNNIVTPDSSFSGNVNSGDTYELREWRFFDGSQTEPYPGYAFLRFKKRMGDRGRTEPLYADVNGLQDEVNVVRAVQSILTNSNWGFDLKVNTTSFDNAAGLTEIGEMKCEGGILNTTSAGDLLRELLGFRDMVLTKIE